MPNRVVIGPLGLGASLSNAMINNVTLLPGLDGELLRAADEHDIDVLAYGLDHITETIPELQPQLQKLAIVSDDDFFHGPELTDPLSGGRCELPRLDEISSPILDTIANSDLAEHCGVTIDSSAVRYFSIQHARLKCSKRRALHVHLLVRMRPSDMVIWSTTQPLSATHATHTVLTSELKLTADAPTTHCLDRFAARRPPRWCPTTVCSIPTRSSRPSGSVRGSV
jgi:hypothetical protein